jgi:hypothetical protein
MTVVTFLLLLVIASAAAGAHTLIIDRARPDRGLVFVARFVAYALLLTLPALLPRLLGG